MGSLRITGGTLGGRKIKIVEREGLRPTSERVREAIMSALNSLIDLNGIKVLDLYAGSGALGIEALSRGAAACHFVEQDKISAAELKRNLAQLGVSQTTVIQNSVEKSLNILSQNGEKFDLIFADPPYGDNCFDALMRQLHAAKIQNDNGIFVFEESSRRSGSSANKAVEKIINLSNTLELIKEKTYGDTKVSFYRCTA